MSKANEMMGMLTILIYIIGNMLLLLFRHPGALAHMDLPRARERNKTLVASFWTPGGWELFDIAPSEIECNDFQDIPGQKMSKDTTKKWKKQLQ